MLSNLIDRVRLPFRKEKELYSSLFEILGFYPRNISYYKLALMHKSVMRRGANGKPVNNERLEFLGDAILDAIVGDIVYRHFPGKREGFLTNTRSKLVQRDTLNRLAQEMGISRLILSSGHNSSHNSYMGGNAFEALVGAIYLDRGYASCMRFMEKRILAKMINIDKVAYKEVNFKSKLIEWSQKNRVKLDFIVKEQGKDKNGSPFFLFCVHLEGIEGCDGRGYSKKESQQLASRLTLERLKKEPQFIDQVFAAKANRTRGDGATANETSENADLLTPDKNAGGELKTATERAENNNTQRTKEADNGNNNALAKEKPKKQERTNNEQAANNATLTRKSEAAKGQRTEQLPRTLTKTEVVEEENVILDFDDDPEFDLSHITARQQSREEIIAAAEAAAFSEEHTENQNQ